MATNTSVKRATVYLEADLHRALRLKAAESSQSISTIVNEAVAESLKEDLDDLESFSKRAAEPVISYEKALKELRRRGKI